MSADVLKHCPEELCQEQAWAKGEVERKIGAGAGLIFSGSGFYLTDYKNSGATVPRGSEKSSSTPASSGDSASSTSTSAPSSSAAPSASADS